MATIQEQAQILIVEDDRAIASAVRRGLAFEGYRVSLAESGRHRPRPGRDHMPTSSS